MTRDQHLKIYGAIWKGLKFLINGIGHIARFPILLVIKPIINYIKWLKRKEEKSDIEDDIFLCASSWVVLCILLVPSLIHEPTNVFIFSPALLALLSFINFE